MCLPPTEPSAPSPCEPSAVAVDLAARVQAAMERLAWHLTDCGVLRSGAGPKDGLRRSDWHALIILVTQESVTAPGLRDALKLAPSTSRDVLRRLADRGLAEREEPGWVGRYHLTEEGQRIARDRFKGREHHLRDLLLAGGSTQPRKELEHNLLCVELFVRVYMMPGANLSELAAVSHAAASVVHRAFRTLELTGFVTASRYREGASERELTDAGKDLMHWILDQVVPQPRA